MVLRWLGFCNTKGIPTEGMPLLLLFLQMVPVTTKIQMSTCGGHLCLGAAVSYGELGGNGDFFGYFSAFDSFN